MTELSPMSLRLNRKNKGMSQTKRNTRNKNYNNKQRKELKKTKKYCKIKLNKGSRLLIASLNNKEKHLKT